MRTRALGFSATVIGLGALAFSAACADQPKPYCQTGRGEFAVRYVRSSGPPECAERKAEMYGIQSYNEPTPGARPGEVIPNVERTPIAIQSAALRAHADSAGSADKVFVTGIFGAPLPDANDLCHVTDLKPVEITLDAVAATDAAVEVEDDEATCTFATPELKARTVRYEWTELSFFVTSAAAGTQLKGKVKITDSSFAGGATCEYEAIGMYPSVSCGQLIIDYADPKQCTPTLDLATSPDPTLRKTNAVPERCTAASGSDLIHGLPWGTSINPDFAVECVGVNDQLVHDAVPSQHLCLPLDQRNGDSLKFPSYK